MIDIRQDIVWLINNARMFNTNMTLVKLDLRALSERADAIANHLEDKSGPFNVEHIRGDVKHLERVLKHIRSAIDRMDSEHTDAERVAELISAEDAHAIHSTLVAKSRIAGWVMICDTCGTSKTYTTRTNAVHGAYEHAIE